LIPFVSKRTGTSTGGAAAITLQQYAHRTFSSLKVRNYRLFFIGQTISLCGTWMQSIAQALLVLKLTGSGTALGLLIGLQCVPVLLLASYGGVLADRFSKRRLLVVTQTTAGGLALALGVLVATGSVRLWMVYVLAFGLGIVNAVDNPVRQTFVHEMVGRSQLGNAITLNSLIVNLSRVVGPAIAGVIVAQFGLGPCFIINGLSFGAVLLCLYLMDGSKLLKSKPVRAATRQLRAGFTYAWKTPEVRDVLLMMALVGTLSYEFGVSIPLLAHVTFPGSEAAVAAGVALLSAMMGVGAVFGGLFTASRRSATLKALTVGAFGFGMSMLLVSVSPSLFSAAAAMVIVGFFSVSFTALTNTLLQLASAARMRGRVMALWTMAFIGSTVIGGPIIGWVGQIVGPRWGLVVGAVAALVAGGIGLKAMRNRSSEVAKLLTSSIAAEPGEPA
jgi:MFS family permease